MKQYNPYSSRASLGAIGLYLRKHKIWEVVTRLVQIKQKTIKHSPMDKLCDAFINILAGGQGIVEVNTRLRSDKALQLAFGRSGCADQSGVSHTLNVCDEQNVEQLRQALQGIYRQNGRGYGHPYQRCSQVLDVDLTGMVAGVQAEEATKGYMAGHKNRRGRQLGRVYATNYGEIVFEKLYPGTVQLERSLQELVMGAEKVLELTQEQRKQTIIRVDGGGGRDADINWLLERDYLILVKVKNWKRSEKLGKTVTEWYGDPKVSDREMGWVETPHDYSRTTRQLALRWRKEDGQWHYRILVFNLPDRMLFDLARHPFSNQSSSWELLSAIVDAYDLRGGGVETSIKGSKSGLHVHKRNKRRFAAQEMLVLLGQLAFNLIRWVQDLLVKSSPAFSHYGMTRMVRDVFQIPGKLKLDPQGQILSITLCRGHPLAPAFADSFRPILAADNMLLILRQI